MKAIFGLVQLGLLVWGIFETINGRWWMLIVAWGIAFAIGFWGRTVRDIDGQSHAAREGARNAQIASRLIDTRQFELADAHMTSAIKDFRAAKEYSSLAFFLPVAAILKAGLGDEGRAARYLSEALQHLDQLHGVRGVDVQTIREKITSMQWRIASGRFDPDVLLEEYMDLTDTLLFE